MPPGLLFARAKVGEHFKLAENVETEAVEEADRCLVGRDRTHQELAVAADPRDIEHETCKRIATPRLLQARATTIGSSSASASNGIIPVMPTSRPSSTATQMCSGP